MKVVVDLVGREERVQRAIDEVFAEVYSWEVLTEGLCGVGEEILCFSLVKIVTCSVSAVTQYLS